jgi:predicted 3-demethylubiquinone-9 3-methyltransferase (glyoxalase superfamily)
MLPKETTMQKITPCLWFDDRIEEAVKFYTSVFPDAKIGKIAHYGEHGPLPKGRMLTATFEIAGQEFMLLNGGSMIPFTDAVSFVVHCDTQAEIDHYWEKLTEGSGAEVQCGWLKDKFGLSWQIVPRAMARWMSDPTKADRVMKALLKMKKLDIAELERAYAG